MRIELLRESNGVQQGHCSRPRGPCRHAPQGHRHADVFQGPESADEVKPLENETDAVPAEQSPACAAPRRRGRGRTTPRGPRRGRGCSREWKAAWSCRCPMGLGPRKAHSPRLIVRSTPLRTVADHPARRCPRRGGDSSWTRHGGGWRARSQPAGTAQCRMSNSFVIRLSTFGLRCARLMTATPSGIEPANADVGQYRRHEANRSDQEATAQREPPRDDDRGLRAVAAMLNRRDDNQSDHTPRDGHAQGLEKEQENACRSLAPIALSVPNSASRSRTSAYTGSGPP